jgi:hypothetical protein
MPDFEIICLANSRKHSGRCVAGLRTDGRGWLRPVTTEGPLNRRHYVLDDNTEAMVLDILNVNLERPDPKPYQPENWVIGSLPWQLVARPAQERYISFLREHIEPGPQLFGNISDRLGLKTLQETPAIASLALVHPSDISWIVTTSIKGKRQVRVRFSLQKIFYNLVITDPYWERRLSLLLEGYYNSSQIGIESINEILFTISLGGPFQGECYKLVASVIIVPAAMR